MKLVDTHVHTMESSRCADISAKDQVKLYKEAGYDAIFITDHLNSGQNKRHYGFDGSEPWSQIVDRYLVGYRTALEEGKKIGLEVFLGVELQLEDHNNDYLIFGVDEEFLYKYENIQKLTLPEVSKIVRDNGMLLIQAHPFRPNMTTDYIDFVDGIEAFNGHPGHKSQNGKAYALALEKGFLMTAGSDCHHLEAGGKCAVATTGMLVYDDFKSTKEFVDAVKNSRCRLLLNPDIK